MRKTIRPTKQGKHKQLRCAFLALCCPEQQQISEKCLESQRENVRFAIISQSTNLRTSSCNKLFWQQSHLIGTNPGCGAGSKPFVDTFPHGQKLRDENQRWHNAISWIMARAKMIIVLVEMVSLVSLVCHAELGKIRNDACSSPVLLHSTRFCICVMPWRLSLRTTEAWSIANLLKIQSQEQALQFCEQRKNAKNQVWWSFVFRRTMIYGKHWNRYKAVWLVTQSNSESNKSLSAASRACSGSGVMFLFEMLLFSLQTEFENSAAVPWRFVKCPHHDVN